MATTHEKQKKGVMYIYRFDSGNSKPESDSSTKIKKIIHNAKASSNWGLRRSKTYREKDHNDGLIKPAASVVASGGGEVVEARKSVCIGERKSVSHLEVNVASVASFLQVKVLVTDMPGFMQVHAFRCARSSYDSLEKFSSKHLAYNLKKV